MASGRPPAPRRRLEGKTDYRTRERALRGRLPMLVPRASNKNITAQVIVPAPEGDRVIASAHSRELLGFGWKGSTKSLPAAYFVGLLAGGRAKKAGIGEAVLYLGVDAFVAGSRATAVAKGFSDSGVGLRADSSIFPPSGRLRGEHVASYGALVRQKEPKRYEAMFSRLLRSGFAPEQYPPHFEEVKSRLLEVLEGNARG